MPDGTKVTIITSGERAIILADTEDYFVTISFDTSHYSYFYDETYIMSRKAIEDFADLFNFTYTITPPQ